MEKKQEWLLALKVHGLRFSDTETDSDDFEEFDHIHEQYKPPPLPLDVIRRNLVVVAPRRPENVWTKRLEAQLEKAKQFSVVEEPLITPVFNHPPIHIPVTDNSLPKKKKKKKRKNKKKRKTNESLSYQEQNLRNSDHELENVHFENAFPEMHSKEASVIFPISNCEVREVEIDESKNETEFVPLDLNNVIEENHRSMKINEINKGNEPHQSIDVKKKNTPEKIETDNEQIDNELPTHLSNSDTLDGIYKENLQYESKETKEIALPTSTIILSEKKKKKNRKRTKHMQENIVSGCTSFNTFSNDIKVYEDKKQENAYEESFEYFDKSDTIKDNILGIKCGFSGGANDEKTSRSRKNKVKHYGTDVLNNIEINGDMSIVPYNDGLACCTLENLLIDSDSHYFQNNYFSGYEYGNAKNILTEFNSFEGVGKDFSFYTSEQEKLRDVRRRRSILFQTYEYNIYQHSNKMVTFKLTEDPKENVCWTKTTCFLNDESEENAEDQSETRSLQYPIDHSEMNSDLFREKDTQIVLRTDQSEFKNIPFLRSQLEISKVPSRFTIIIHLIFFFIFLDLVLSFMNWVLDHLVSITLFLMYIIFNIFSGIFNFDQIGRK
nr:uncharacterized protein LOC111505609 isoform X4 [Leptinotarsa decemlineata]